MLQNDIHSLRQEFHKYRHAIKAAVDWVIKWLIRQSLQ